MNIYEPLVIIGVPVVRGIAGWAENAFADAKITIFEWKKLAETILRLGVPAAGLYYGFKLPVEISAAVPLIVDYMFKYIKKLNKNQ